ncbi:DUF3466 family protein [Nostoc sp. CHAB 5844]|nr:DUF3466 family protein [Nostoc sp. CHAB 5844]
MLKMKSLKTTIKNLGVVSSSAVLVSLGINTSAMAANFYNITDLSSDEYANHAPFGEYATGINDKGQVVGYVEVHNRFKPSWFWSPETGKISIATGVTVPTAINNASQVSVFRSTTDYGSWSGVWTRNTGVSFLDNSIYPYSIAAYDINNVGQVVGFSNFSSEAIFDEDGQLIFPETQDHAVLWNSSTDRIDLGTLPGRDRSYASAINDQGQVVGYSDTSEGTAGAHAFLWNENTGITDLGTLSGRNRSYAQDINNAGQIVGYSDNDGRNTRAVLWNEGTDIIDLGTLSGANNSAAYGINNVGQIVGTSNAKAVLWDEDFNLTDLNTLIDPSSGWTLYSASEINNKGQIIAYGNNLTAPDTYLVRILLLTPRTAEPVPEPITMGGTLLGGVGLAYLRRRQRRLRSAKVAG